MNDIFIISDDGKTLVGVKDRSITHAEVPEGVTSIRWDTFQDCSSLQAISIPSSVTWIEEGAFMWSSMKKIHVDKRNKHFSTADGALYNKDFTKLICLPAKKRLKQYTVREGVKEIGTFSFALCHSIERICLPDSVEDIGYLAFANCEQLLEIYVSESHSRFSSADGILFSKDGTELLCMPAGKKLTHYSIPDNVKSIGENAFSDCEVLQSIDVPDSVTKIGGWAFDSCIALKSIRIPDGVTVIESGVFSRCEAMQSIHIPDSVTEIGGGAFAGCTALQSIHIPDSVTKLSRDFNRDCHALQDISVAESNQCFSSADGILFSKDGTELLRMPAGKRLTYYSIPKNVKVIGENAFSGCEVLQSIDVPDSVTKIGGWAFSDCTALQHFDFPEGITKIDTCVFSDCTALRSVSIPESVTEINFGIFDNCSELRTIRCKIRDLEKVNISKLLALPDEVYDYCVLYVPAGTKQQYETHRLLKWIEHIVEEKEEELTDTLWPTNLLLAATTRCSRA